MIKALLSKFQKKWYKVELPFGKIDLVWDGYEFNFKVDPAIWDWIHQNKVEHRYRVNEATGARWLELTDKHMAIQCKLLFG